MNLNAREQKYINRIKRNQKYNKWLRWMKLLCAVFLFAVGISALRLVADGSEQFILNDNKMGVLAVSMAYPLCLFQFGLASVIMAQTFLTWNGDIGRNLLVRLVEHHEETNG